MDDLEKKFMKLIPKKIKALKRALQKIEDEDESENEQIMKSIRRILRSLKSTSSIDRFKEIGRKAEEVDELEGEEFYKKLKEFIKEIEDNLELAKEKESKNLLLIDDNEKTIELIRSILPEDEYNIIQVASKNKARAALLENETSLIIMDVILPDADGRNLLSEFKSDPDFMSIPIIILSEKDLEMIKDECLALGANEFITKPFDVDDFIETVSSNLLEETTEQETTNIISKKELIQKFNSLQNKYKNSTQYTISLLQIENFDEIENQFGSQGVNKIFDEYNRLIQNEIAGDKYYSHWFGEEYLIFFPESREESIADLLNDFAQKLENHKMKIEGSKIKMIFSAGCRQFDFNQDIEDAYFKVSKILHNATDADEPQILCSKNTGEIKEEKVLLAEEDEIVTSLISHRLQKENYKVTSVQDGAEVLSTLKKDTSYCMVIINVKLQEMSGFEIIDEIKNNPKIKSIPIIILTSMGKENDIIKGLEIGANDYIVKPFSPHELVARVERLIRKG